MKMKTLFMMMLVVTATVHAGESEEAVAADAIIGIWATDKAEAHVEIAKEPDETYSATIIWLKDPLFPPDDEGGMAGELKVDRENPDPELRSRPIEGLQIMQGMVHDGGRHWSDGEIYDPESGKTYSSKIRLTDSGTLRVRGYVGISLFGRTTEWTPVLMNETPSGSLMDEIDTDQTMEDASNGQGEPVSNRSGTGSESDEGVSPAGKPDKTITR